MDVVEFNVMWVFAAMILFFGEIEVSSEYSESVLYNANNCGVQNIVYTLDSTR